MFEFIALCSAARDKTLQMCFYLRSGGAKFEKEKSVAKLMLPSRVKHKAKHEQSSFEIDETKALILLTRTRFHFFILRKQGGTVELLKIALYS